MKYSEKIQLALEAVTRNRRRSETLIKRFSEFYKDSPEMADLISEIMGESIELEIRMKELKSVYLRHMKND